jgi:hypothetical protein
MYSAAFPEAVRWDWVRWDCDRYRMRLFSRPPDRRRSKRFKADVRVVVTLVGTTDVIPVRALCESISEAGLRASGLGSLAVGDRVTLELDIPVAKQRIWVDAVVRRGGDHCALEFVSLNDEQRNLVKRYCRLQPEERRRL